MVYTAEDIVWIHEGIFGPVFGEQVLSMRSERTHVVSFPYWVTDGSGAVQQRARDGVQGGIVHREVVKALRKFEKGLLRLQVAEEKEPIPLADALRVALQLYVQILRIHPFYDGNGRTAWVVMVYAMRRVGLPIPAKPVDMVSRCALGAALKPTNNSLDPLVKLIGADLQAMSR